MKIIRFIISFLITFILFYLLEFRLADAPIIGNADFAKNAPPLGSFLNPFEGFWQNAETKNQNHDISLNLQGAKEEINIYFDNRLVPHIFARNDYDLYFAQGYVTAKYRLWQMEFQTYAAGGRLSEIIDNPKALALDQKMRRMGMVYAAEKAVEAINQDEKTKETMEAYAAGVNAYIDNLSYKDYPLEYKLLNYKPEKWTVLKSALLLKYMALDLSGMQAHPDLEMTEILKEYGKNVTNQLFPNYAPFQDPIIPAGTAWDFKPKQIPRKPKKISTDSVEVRLKEIRKRERQNRNGIGSNNWAISADKSSTGYPILANDPHLKLSLPSIWYEIQLVSPDVNVYGVSLPGAPCVVIGFNKNISWGVTNVDADVLDWYKIKFDSTQKDHYWYHDTLRKVEKRIEEIKRKNKPSLKEELWLTKQGIVFAKPDEKKIASTYNVPLASAMRWTAHEESNELMTFYKLNRANNYNEYRKALSTYVCPAQNFVYADVHKDIAITVNGKFPLKWEQQGKYILDGSNPQHDWQGWIPFRHNPHIKNPERGFVSSANQFSTDTLYPYYLNWHFATYERGKRINEMLAKMKKASAKDLIRLQNDDLHILAKDVLPTMLKYIDARKLKGDEKKAYETLKNWDFHAKMKETAPIIFKTWYEYFSEATWNDDFKEKGLHYKPKRDLTAKMLLINDSIPQKWFDNVNTEKQETLSDILDISFTKTIQTLVKNYGKFGDAWQWGRSYATTIEHISKSIKAFDVPNLATNGGKEIVNATTQTHGPSWRMVVELGRPHKAYGIYPGGQSGNPGSHYYNNMVEKWIKGELYELKYFKRSSEAREDENILFKLKIGK